MSTRTPSSAASMPPPTVRRRRPQTRLGNDSGGGVLVDLRVPAAAHRRRLTLANVSAVCEQLGDHVSTRNVQRVLGGSLRDIGPLVQAWRENRDAGDAAAATSGDHMQALGAILRGALQDHSATVAAALKDQALANAATQQALFDRVERLVGNRARELAKAGPARERPNDRDTDSSVFKELRRDLQDLNADVGRLLARGADAAPAASAQDIADLGRQIDRLAQSLEQLQTEHRAPAAPDLEGLLAPVLQRLEGLADTLATIAAAPPAQTGVALPTLDRIEASLVALATPKPPVRAQPSRAILSRLDTLLAATAELPAKLKAAVTPPKRKPKPATTRTARKPAVKNASRRRSAKAVVAKKTAQQPRKPKSTAKKPAKSTHRKVVKPAAPSRRAPAKKQGGTTVGSRHKTIAVRSRKKAVAKAKKASTAAAKKASHRKSKRTR